MNLEEKLTKIGFDKEEIAIYLYLLKNEGAYPSTIAKDLDISRPTVYRYLDTLSIRGWVSEVEAKKKLYYTAQSPKRLERYIDLQISRKEEEKSKLHNLLPELENMYAEDSSKPHVITETGREGVRATYFDHVDVEKSYEMLAWANAPRLYEFMTKTDFKKYVKEKEAKKITTRGIVPEQSEKDSFLEKVYAGIEKKYWPVLRYIKDTDFPYKGEVTIYGEDKVSFINLSEENLSATIIKDPTIHHMMKLAFEQAWESLGE